MNIRIAIYDIIKQVCEMKTKKEKIDFLRKHDSPPLRTILILMYHPQVKWYLPNSTPPYKNTGNEFSFTALYNETKRLRIFYRGGGYDDLDQKRREYLFIQILENVHPEDAKLLIDLVQKVKYKGITAKLVNEAFGEIIKVTPKPKKTTQTKTRKVKERVDEQVKSS